MLDKEHKNQVGQYQVGQYNGVGDTRLCKTALIFLYLR
jgi:hypothetical protein